MVFAVSFPAFAPLFRGKVHICIQTHVQKSIVGSSGAGLCSSQNRPDGFVKRPICKAHEPWKGETYFLYVEPLRGEVQP